jgi:hypothetical protein
MSVRRVAELMSQQPWSSLLAAVVLGLVAPLGFHRILRGVVVVVLWTALVISLVPAGVVASALAVGGGFPKAWRPDRPHNPNSRDDDPPHRSETRGAGPRVGVSVPRRQRRRPHRGRSHPEGAAHRDPIP